MLNYLKTFILFSTLCITHQLAAQPVIKIHPAVQAVNELGENLSEYPKLPTDLQTAINYDFGVESTVYSPDGEYLLAGDASGGINVWDSNNGELLKRIAGHSAHVSALSPDDSTLAIRTDDGILLWSITANQPSEIISHLLGYPDTVAFNEDGSFLIAKDYADGCIQLWELDTSKAKTISSIALVEVDINRAIELGFNCPDSNTLNTMKVIEEKYRIYHDSISFHPDGDKVAFSHYYDKVSIWDTNTKEKIDTSV